MDGNNSTSNTTIGFGLKRWRRIPRDSAKDGHPSSADLGKAVVLKRLLSTAAPAESESSSKSSTAASAPPKPKPKPKPKPNPNPEPEPSFPSSKGKGKKARAAHSESNGHDPLLHLRSLHDALAKEVAMFGDMAIGEENGLHHKLLSLQHNVDLLEAKLHTQDSQMDALFKQRMAAEIEYLAITEATRSFKLQATLLNDLECAAHQQTHMLSRLRVSETKAENLRKQVISRDTLVSGTGVYKLTCCFFIQFLLLIFALSNFVLQLSPDPAAVVPT